MRVPRRARTRAPPASPEPAPHDPPRARRSPTLADIAAYSDIGQLAPRFLNLIDVAPYPNLARWLAAMEQVRARARRSSTFSLSSPAGDLL